MELECVKYKEKMASEDAACTHPGDYCKFRTACIIHFLGAEKKSKEPSAPKGSGHPDTVGGKGCCK